MLDRDRRRSQGARSSGPVAESPTRYPGKQTLTMSSGDGAPIQRKPQPRLEGSSSGAGWHDPEIADGVDLDLLGESDGKKRFLIRGTDIEFAYREDGNRYYDLADMWIDASDLTKLVTRQRGARGEERRRGEPHEMRRRTTGKEKGERGPEAGRLSWLSNRFTRADGTQITRALKHALIIYDSMGRSPSDGENFTRDARAWKSEHEGIATISFLELMLDNDPELKKHIQELIGDHVARQPLNVVVLGHGQAYKNLHQVMRDAERRPVELQGEVLIAFLDKLAELTGHQPIGSLMLHGCGTVRTAQEIDAIMRRASSTDGEPMIGEIFSPERLQVGIGIAGPVRRYAEHLGGKYDPEHADEMNRHNYVVTLKENNVGSLQHIAATSSGSSIWRLFGSAFCGMGAPDPQSEDQPEESPEAHRLVSSLAKASLSFSRDWKLIELAYAGVQVDATGDLARGIEGWVQHVRGVIEHNHGPLEEGAGTQIAWTPGRVRQIMQELGFFD